MENITRISESHTLKKNRLDKMVRRNTVTGICEEENKSIKNNHNGAQRKRTLAIRDMWDVCKIFTYAHLEFQDRREKMKKEIF